MRILGEFCLLAAFVASGYAAFAALAGARRGHRGVLRSGLAAAGASFAAVTAALVILAWALLARDFSFDYVARYCSRLLPWNYALSALWVGQAGSLLLWAWVLAGLALLFRFLPSPVESGKLRDTALAMLMGYLCFLLGLMLFAADPMKASIAAADEGAGLSPLLQHPAMMVHPPIVFTGYAAWAIPFALAMAALVSGRLDTAWVRLARPWALVAWTVLGAGILIGGWWAYEELGWGGYWGWDPVENGSLIPWLTGTALIHALMVWRYRGGLKKAALGLAVATFGLCNLATFLTRSGIFSSLHAFSQSPIGWMFLVLMLVLAAAGTALILIRRKALRTPYKLQSFWARETLVLASAVLLLLLTGVVVTGTLMFPLTSYVFDSKAVVGPEFYNAVLVPIGLLLLSATAAVPLLRWGGPPTAPQRKLLGLTAVVAVVSPLVAWACGARHVVSLLVAFLAALAGAAFVAALWHDARRRFPRRIASGMLRTLLENRRQYAGYVIHLGFVCLAVGITGSSLGTRKHEASLQIGEKLEWAGRRIEYARLIQRELPDKLVAEAELQITEAGGAPYRLRPGRHFHHLQHQWTTEVDIHSTWSGDFYTILNSGQTDGTVSLTFVENPLIRWMWLGGYVVCGAALFSLWPTRKRSAAAGALPQRKSPPSAQPRSRRAAA